MSALNNREHARQRADWMRNRAAELKQSDDERDQEHAHELEQEADEIDHYCGLADIEDAR